MVDAAAEALFWPRAATMLIVVGIFIALGTISANVFAGPRVYYAMARDGLVPAGCRAVHPGRIRRLYAIVAQAVWSVVLVLTGSFARLVTYTGFAVVLFAGIAVLALFVLRRREPDAPRPFRRSDTRWRPACSSSRARRWSSTPSGGSPCLRSPASRSSRRAFPCTGFFQRRLAASESTIG